MGRKKTTGHSKKLSEDDTQSNENESVENDIDEDADGDVDLEIEADVEASGADANLPSLDVDWSNDPAFAVSSSAVSSTDPLKRYIQEVGRYALLAPEEEFRLAKELIQTGDISVAKRLVSANLRLVIKIAMEYRSIYTNLLDLIQEGNIGLMKAVSKFDPTKGARLGYYASWWIRSYILKYLLDNFRLVKVGTTQAQKKLFYHLVREKERLEAQGLLAGPKLLAEKLHVREKDVVEMQQRLLSPGAEVSLDTPVRGADEGRGASHMDLMPDEGELPDEALSRDQMLRILKEKLPEFEQGLNEKERRILQDRLLAEEPQTLQEVADRYGLTRERARQIEARVIQKLAAFLKIDPSEND